MCTLHNLCSGGTGLSMSDQQKVLVSGGIAALQQHQLEAKDRQVTTTVHAWNSKSD